MQAEKNYLRPILSSDLQEGEEELDLDEVDRGSRAVGLNPGLLEVATRESPLTARSKIVSARPERTIHCGNGPVARCYVAHGREALRPALRKG